MRENDAHAALSGNNVNVPRYSLAGRVRYGCSWTSRRTPVSFP